MIQQDDVGITNIFIKREMKILKICEVIKRQTIPRKIALAFIINIMIVLIVIIISLVIQFQNIKQSQQQIPNLFFKSYNQYSMEEVALRAKNLILAFVDFRMSFIMSVRNAILSNSTKINQNLSPSQILSYFKKQPNIQNCQIPKANLSIFSCKMDFYTKFIVESAWKFQTTRPIRRFNLIYQNLKNQNDIMIKSISNISDMNLTDVKRLNDQFKIANATNILYISSFYKDAYGQSSQNLVSFSTQLIFPNYRILIELQTFGSFMKQTISRIAYSDKANIVILALNDSLAERYSIVSFYQNPDPDLNYTNLLSKTHATSYLPDGQIIYSFSLPFSSSYKIGSLNFINQPLQNKNFILIVHSPRITKTMEENTYGFINNLSSSLVQIVIVLFFVITIWNITNILLLANKLTTILNSIKDTINKYMNDPDKYLEAINQLNRQNLSDYLVGFILKSVISIIKMIEHNKKKFKKKSKKIQRDYYPLNLFDRQFMQKQGILDLQRFEALKLRLRQNQHQNKKTTRRANQ